MVSTTFVNTAGLASDGEGPAFENLRVDADDNANAPIAKKASGLGKPPRPFLSSFASTSAFVTSAVTNAFGTVSTTACGNGGASAGDLPRHGSIPQCFSGNMSWEGISSLVGSE